jgi:hypothetical protein
MAKPNPRMKALAAEAVAAEPNPTPDPNAAPEPGPAPAPEPNPLADGDAMMEFCRLPVMLIGNTLCGGYGVTQLSPEEIERLARALAGVCAVNGLTFKDPRIASALVLGGTLAHVAGPRVLEYRAKVAKARADIDAARARADEEKPGAQAA